MTGAADETWELVGWLAGWLAGDENALVLLDAVEEVGDDDEPHATTTSASITSASTMLNVSLRFIDSSP